MKWLIILSLSLFVVSCQKKQCWKCHIVQWTTEPHNPDSIAAFYIPVPICDKTKKDIDAYASNAMSSHIFYYYQNDGTRVGIDGDFKSIDCN
jgi:hypothetical protein